MSHEKQPVLTKRLEAEAAHRLPSEKSLSPSSSFTPLPSPSSPLSLPPFPSPFSDNVDLESIKDEKERRQIESIINNFGQTPTQLFTEPHPQRWTLEAAQKNQVKGYSSTFTGKRTLVNLFEHLHDLKAHCVDVCMPLCLSEGGEGGVSNFQIHVVFVTM